MTGVIPALERIGHPERGSGTALGVGLGMVLILVLAAGVVLIQATTAAGRAASAADLAALAAADAARGIREGEPCLLAAQVADRNGAELQSCSRKGAAGEIVDITTTVNVPALLRWTAAHAAGQDSAHAVGRSRAGPPP